MRERHSEQENGNVNAWESFAQKNPDLQSLQEKDPEGYEFVKEFFGLRKGMNDRSDQENKKLLADFGERLDQSLGDNDDRSTELSSFFTEIRDL